jgi:IS30 family transposase
LITVTTTKREQILTRSDAGESVAAISGALDVTPGYVYGVLRTERPRRARKVRDKTSELRRMVLGLAAQKIPPARIAFLLQRSCKRQYIYRILAEG